MWVQLAMLENGDATNSDLQASSPFYVITQGMQEAPDFS
jgi:hypothetical protein